MTCAGVRRLGNKFEGVRAYPSGVQHARRAGLDRCSRPTDIANIFGHEPAVGPKSSSREVVRKRL